MANLGDYLTDLRIALHDQNKDLWDDDAILLRFINRARNRVCEDTWCLKAVFQVTLTAGEESLNLSFPNQTVVSLGYRKIFAPYSINLILSSTSKTQIIAKPWIDFSYMRTWSAMPGQPIYASQNGNIVYFLPKPNITYQSEWDTIVYPTAMALTNQITEDVIDDKYYDLIMHRSAAFAYEEEKALQEEQIQLSKYESRYRQITGRSIVPTKRFYFGDKYA